MSYMNSSISHAVSNLGRNDHWWSLLKQNGGTEYNISPCFLELKENSRKGNLSLSKPLVKYLSKIVGVVPSEGHTNTSVVASPSK